MSGLVPALTLGDLPVRRRIWPVLVTRGWQEHVPANAMFVPVAGRTRLRFAARFPGVGRLHAAGLLNLQSAQDAGVRVLRSPRGTTYLAAAKSCARA